ncbi:hypothetical protein VKT23_014044 [Stygiomarasmius scandens]|uniref:Aminoglycoside phosphotransferase domain-containing protein n=1 Tax=Marasmiellus scandens TaxID=2682957 RepID=A0ABR1J1S2_9AGAR
MASYPEEVPKSATPSFEDEEEFANLIAALEILQLQEIALQTQKQLESALDSDITCAVDSPPLCGSFNLVYKVLFSDGIAWVIRIPAREQDTQPSAVRRLEGDILTQRFIQEKAPSIPIPRIHAWSLDTANIIRRPYVIADFVRGTTLFSVWNDKNWISSEKRQKIFNQLAEWMTELAAIELPRIGRLELTSGLKDQYTIVPFEPHTKIDDVGSPLGPYDSGYAFLSDLLKKRRENSDDPMFALLQFFLSVLIDHTIDGPPFTLRHPDFDSQNILVAEDGTITGLIDWDGVSAYPRQGGAAAYPSWLTVDWDPLYHGWHPSYSEEQNAKHDSPEELHLYREMYLAAIDSASQGKLTHITRNSHLWHALIIAATGTYATAHIARHLSKFVLGSGILGHEIEHSIKSATWFKMGPSLNSIAYLKGLFIRRTSVP